MGEREGQTSVAKGAPSGRERGLPRAPEAGPRPSVDAEPSVTGWVARLGGRAAHDAITAAWSAPHSGSAAESAASGLADTLTGMRPPGGGGAHDQNPTISELPSARGDPLPDAIRSPLERVTGVSLDNVEVLRTRLGRGIVAATHGTRIAIDDRAARAPHAPWILAHELGHVFQQKRSGARSLAMWPDGDARAREGAVMADFDMGGDDSDAEYRYHREQDFSIAGPSLVDPAARTASDSAFETVRLRGVDRKERIDHYAIPISQVTHIAVADPGPAPLGAPIAGPVWTPTAGPSVVATPIEPGSRVTTPDGEVHTVLFASGEHVVVDRFTRFAVGAGSMSLMRTPSGYIFVDAGKQGAASGELTSSLVAAARRRIGSEPVLGALTTHIDADHINLLSALAAEMDIGDIFVNEVQARDPRYIAERGRIDSAIRARRAAAFTNLRNDTTARAAFVRELERTRRAEILADPDYVEHAWGNEVERRTTPARETREVTVRTVEGRLRPAVVRTLGVDGPDGAERPATDTELDLTGPGIVGFADPALATIGRAARHQIDRFSSHWLLEIDGSARFLIIPDIRAADFALLRGEFTAAVRRAGMGRSVQFWDATHHAQIGVGGGASEGARHGHGSVLRAQDLQSVLQFMHDFRATESGGVAGRDAVVTSVDPTKVDIGTIELLRSLGFEPFLAVDGLDVQVFEILTSTGERVTGVLGRAVGVAGAQTLRRAHAARDSMDARLVEIREELARSSADERGPLEAERSALEQRRTELLALERAYVREVDRLSPGRHHGGPEPTTESGVSQRQAVDDWLTARDYPTLVTTASLELAPIALYLIGHEPGGATPAEGTPEAATAARGRRLAGMRSSLNTLHADIERAGKGVDPAERARYLAELLAYQEELRPLIAEHAEGSSTRAILEADLTRTEQALQTAIPDDAEVAHERAPTGELFETRVISVEDAKAHAERVSRARTIRGMMTRLDQLGRGMGAVMVVTSITGERDRIDRYEHGRATAAELVFGSAHSVASAGIGVQMLRGARVGPGAFVVVSLLEVGEAAFADYDSRAAQNRAIGRAVVHGAVNLGCMAAGDAIMAAGAASLNPVVLAVGAVVSFIGPLVINALFDWLTDEEPFQPESITDLYEELQRLLERYRLAIGDLRIARRRGYALTEVGGDPAINETARQAAILHLDEAMVLEPLVLDAFATAYSEARTNHMGLPQLDAWRRNFLELQLEATPTDDEATGVDRTSAFIFVDGFPHLRPSAPTDVMGRFRTIEEELVESSRSMTAEDVANMSQWSRLREGLDDLWSAIENVGDGDTWAYVMSKLDEVETMLENARYRLDPSIALNRTRALIPEGTDARAAYEARLADAEASLRRARLRIAESPELAPLPEGIPVLDLLATSALVELDPATGEPLVPSVYVALPWNPEDFAAPSPLMPALIEDPSGGPLLLAPPMLLDVDAAARGDLPIVRSFNERPEEVEAVQHAQDAINAFETALGRRSVPTGFAPDALHASSTELARYRTYIGEHREFRLQLAEIEVHERTAQQLLAEARRAFGSDFDPNDWNGSFLVRAERRFRALVDERKVVRLLLYPSELGEHIHDAAQAGLDYFAALFRVEGSPLSAEEELALERDHDPGLRHGPVSIGDRLELVEELRVPAAPSESVRTLGLYRTRAGEEGLVGITRTLWANLLEVIALDAAAETLLGGRAPHVIAQTSFHPLTLEELSARLAQTRAP